jgi:hypothetical protein
MRKIVLEKIVTLITAAFGLVAALAWNDTVKEIIKNVFGENETVLAMLIYAVSVTIIAVIVSMYLGKILEYNEKKFLRLMKLGRPR